MKIFQVPIRKIFIFFLACLSIHKSSAQVFNQVTDNLPPCPDTSQNFEYTQSIHQSYGGMVDLSNASHYAFSNCFAPPLNIGDTTTHSFGSMALGTVHVTSGPTFTMNSPGQVTVQVIFSSQNGNIRTFNNEMTQLDISGGTLPPGALIRESPLHASTGQTTIELVGGTYTINSYFDVWTDLSLDSGATWIPCDTSGRMTLVDYPLGISSTTSAANNFYVTPNPVIDILTINGFLQLGSTISIYDIFGRKLKEEKLNSSSQEISVTDFPCGIYFIEASRDGNRVMTRFIKI